jgi:hypothetical protein
MNDQPDQPAVRGIKVGNRRYPVSGLMPGLVHFARPQLWPPASQIDCGG